MTAENRADAYPVLVAEDEEVSRQRLALQLRKLGYTATLTENGKQALDAFNRGFHPIVLTDWMMPEIDGLELCRRIRRSSFQGYVYIILLTAKDSRENIVSGLESGADDYATKPLHPAELDARLRTAIRILEMEKSLKTANDRIRILSITDPLTGCYNRAYIAERLPKEIRKAKRYEHPLGLVMCDIDHFKRVNDTYGHHAGDSLLQSFVSTIQDGIRDDTDWLARYGGEEFVIVVPETDYRGAGKMAERLRTAVCRETVEVDSYRLQYTVSFGVTGIGAAAEAVSIDRLIGKADEYLYRSKQEGRNRVVSGAL